MQSATHALTCSVACRQATERATCERQSDGRRQNDERRLRQKAKRAGVEGERGAGGGWITDCAVAQHRTVGCLVDGIGWAGAMTCGVPCGRDRVAGSPRELSPCLLRQ